MRHICVYENPDTSEVSKEFRTLQEALQFRSLTKAQIVSNGTILAVVAGRRWVLTREGAMTLVHELPRVAQRQDALNDQLADLRTVADRLGMYDASDLITRVLGDNTYGDRTA